MAAPSCFDATVRLIDDGFFRPRAQLGAELVDANKFRHIPVAELPVAVQFVRTSTAAGSVDSAEHLVLWTHYPRLDDAALAACVSAIARALPNLPITAVRDVTLAYVADTVDIETRIDACHLNAPAAAVAAAAAAQCWGTLADVERVTVHLAGHAYVARTHFDPPVWRVNVTRSPE